MTEHLWQAGSAGPNTKSAGFYTQSRFRKDVKTVAKLVVARYPALASVFSWLVVHSLRKGLPTALQSIKNLPVSVQKALGRWHSSSHEVYQVRPKYYLSCSLKSNFLFHFIFQCNMKEANQTSYFLQQSMTQLALNGPGAGDQFVLPSE